MRLRPTEHLEKRKMHTQESSLHVFCILQVIYKENRTDGSFQNRTEMETEPNPRFFSKQNRTWKIHSAHPYHTSCLTPSHHVLLRQQKGRWWRKRSGGKVHSMRGNWCRDFEARCPSFLKPPTDSRGKKRCCILCQLSDIVTHLQ